MLLRQPFVVALAVAGETGHQFLVLGAGLLAGDPSELAHQLWALTRGLVVLEARGSLGDDPDQTWMQAMSVIAEATSLPKIAG